MIKNPKEIKNFKKIKREIYEMGKERMKEKQGENTKEKKD